MRQPIRRRRKSKDWMLTYGLTTVFVVGSLWYLDLIPVEQFLNFGSQQTGQVVNDSEGTEPLESIEDSLAGVEQWEPEVTTTDDEATGVPVTRASFAEVQVGESATDSATLPFPAATQTENTATENTATVGSDTNRPLSLSEQERISRIFGTAGTNPKTGNPASGNATTNPGGSAIVPVSAERPAAGFPLTNDSFAQIDRWIAEGQYLKAHRDLSQRYWKEDEPLEPLLTRLNKTAGMIYFAPQPHFMPSYEVQPGDLLQSVAPRYQLSWEYLARLNRVRPERVRAGQKLKVIKGPFAAFIDLSDFSLTIHAHGYFVKRYDIGIGKDNSTPMGTFSVKDKLKNPKYYGSDAVIEADDPTNPLGERWIDIGDSYGIHGTIDPDSIRKAESRGCLRLNNEDVVEVYDFLTSGSEVVIRP